MTELAVVAALIAAPAWGVLGLMVWGGVRRRRRGELADHYRRFGQ